jgi:hypothetical protein
MDYWHDIIKNYGALNSNGSRSNDHGTQSQKTSVILLIYLAFGTDYPSGIAKYFSELKDSEQLVKNCPRVLTNSNKVSSVLKQMREDKLVNDPKIVRGKATPRYYYALNSQILQSPIRDSTTYITHDGSPFTIPLETVKGFLEWLALEQAGTTEERTDGQLRQKRHELADRIFERLFISEPFDYFRFLDFIKDEAEKWESLIKTSNQQPALSKLISDYISEIDNGEYILRKFVFVRGFT